MSKTKRALARMFGMLRSWASAPCTADAGGAPVASTATSFSAPKVGYPKPREGNGACPSGTFPQVPPIDGVFHPIRLRENQISSKGEKRRSCSPH